MPSELLLSATIIHDFFILNRFSYNNMAGVVILFHFGTNF